MSIKQKSIFVVGLTRDTEKTIEQDIQRINLSLTPYFEKIRYVLVESDSKDNTVKKLMKVKNENKNFEFFSLGFLESKYKIKSERLAYCRNIYLDFIKKSSKREKIDFILVYDFDNINNKLNKKTFYKVFKLSFRWDAIFPNQNGPYYDIWALRKVGWQNSDCMESYVKLSKDINLYQSFNLNVIKKQIKIKSRNKPIRVSSAFGGMGLYKTKIFLSSKYKGIYKSQPICEHVPFNLNLKSKKLYIVPFFINAKRTSHTKLLSRLKYILIDLVNL